MVTTNFNMDLIILDEIMSRYFVSHKEKEYIQPTIKLF